MKNHHFKHVQEYLERVRDGYAYIPDPESVYLGRAEDDHFWELVGLGLHGCPVTVLAALRLARQERMGVSDARASLAAFLSTNQDPNPGGSTIEALLPSKDQEIPQFLAPLRAGREFAPVRIDRLQVEVAFDFRADNPWAVRAARQAAAPLKRQYFRTVSGHVFRGEAHPVEMPLHAPEARFLAVRGPEQLLPQGVIRLPTLFVAHRFVGLQADASEDAARLAVRNWVPFVAATASREGLIPVG